MVLRKWINIAIRWNLSIGASLVMIKNKRYAKNEIGNMYPIFLKLIHQILIKLNYPDNIIRIGVIYKEAALADNIFF